MLQVAGMVLVETGNLEDTQAAEGGSLAVRVAGQNLLEVGSQLVLWEMYIQVVVTLHS